MKDKTYSSVERSDDTQYGSVFNGGTVGSGYDVSIKRESDDTALVSVEKVGTKIEWLAEIGVESNEDLQARAQQIGQCPSAELEGCLVSTDSDDWETLADRWDKIAIE